MSHSRVNSESLKEDMANLSLEDRLPEEAAPAAEAAAPGVPKPTREEDMARARDYNFPAQIPFDYTTASVSAAEALGLSWFANAKVYEWSDDFGDVGPADPELEKELFSAQYHSEEGNQMSNLTYFSVEVEGATEIEPIRAYKDAGLHPVILDNINKYGYKNPTPVQCYSIPAALSGYDVFGVAQAGSGKTAAYLLPIASKLMGKYKKLAAPRPGLGVPVEVMVTAEPLALVIVPTRELATQIFDHCRRICYRSMLRPVVVYGGAPIPLQIKELAKGCDILIATPGRLQDFLRRDRVLTLRRLKYVVLDEADELVQDDWQESISAILAAGHSNQSADQNIFMFSATFSEAAQELAKKFLSTEHVQIRVGRIGSTHRNITQHIIWVDDDKKKDALYDLLYSVPPARTLIFVNSKRTCEYVDDYLYHRGIPVTSIHADRTQREREDALTAFRTAKAPVMVTTSVAARGLDVRGVMHVINYDLPTAQHGGIDEYVHRIGRTARIGNEGLATSFFNESNSDIAAELTTVLEECGQKVQDFMKLGGEEAEGADNPYEDPYSTPENPYAETAEGASEAPTEIAATEPKWD